MITINVCPDVEMTQMSLHRVNVFCLFTFKLSIFDLEACIFDEQIDHQVSGFPLDSSRWDE